MTQQIIDTGTAVVTTPPDPNEFPGLLALPIQAMRELVASSAAFQALVGCDGDPVTALESVYPLIVTDGAIRPFCVVDWGEVSGESEAGGLRACFPRIHRSFDLMFEDTAIGDETYATTAHKVLYFAGKVGEIIEDIMEQPAAITLIPLASFKLGDFEMKAGVRRAGDVQRASGEDVISIHIEFEMG